MTDQKTTQWYVPTGPLTRVRRLAHRVRKGNWAHYGIPQIPLALAAMLAGLFLLWNKFGARWHFLLTHLPSSLLSFAPSSMPFLLIGLGLVFMSFGLVSRSRIAWIAAVVLTLAMVLMLLLFPQGIRPLFIYYDLVLLILLLITHGAFTRTSLAASTLFAITSSLVLLIYAVFGSLYLGNEFAPPIKTLGTAFYYSVVTMSTVGYGDITPKTTHARLFTVSIIILGIGIFATSISAIVGPVVSRSINEIVRGKEGEMKRADHFIIVGSTPLAFNSYRELKKRNQPVTLIMAQPPAESGFEDADIIIGDANDLEVLNKAGAKEAQAVLAMRADDSENAFIALAVKELKGKAKTIVAVNDSKHFERVRLAQPDFIIAPQVLGGEMLAMVLSGEPITSEFVTDRFLHSNLHAPSKHTPR